MHYPFRPGEADRLGAHPEENGVNFCIFTHHATSVSLVLFDQQGDQVLQVIELDPTFHRTDFFWHVFVEGLPAGIQYGWRIDGPKTIASERGAKFFPDKLLLDPWAKAVTDSRWNRGKAVGPGDNTSTSMRSHAVRTDDYDWEGDQPLNLDLRDTIIYEMHVAGFTRHPSSGVSHPGTFHALIEKIPYLKELGVTAVELLPVMAFDEADVPQTASSLGLHNFWGYSTHSFFSPHPRYCVTPEKGTHLHEFRDMVKAFHRAGIEVILDVVFNHTSEGNHLGPAMNFKGMVNEMFYHLDYTDRAKYRDYTGCGNTVSCNNPFAVSFIVSCLEYWVQELHVDGFRFDLASVMGRDADGKPMEYAPVIWGIEFSPILRKTKLIAEAWDAGGLYQVGNFPGFRWREWNGKYRDDIRRFIKGDDGVTGDAATRICGSEDLYGQDFLGPMSSINFITCHDGFTLWDLVSYNDKHNTANGEGNRDGCDNNCSWNCGHEGDTTDPSILRLRERQAKNCTALLMLSQGVPMLLAGDEVLRSQEGNNNGYCQDNPIGWFNWEEIDSNRDTFRFTKEIIAFRQRHSCLRRDHFLSGTKRNARGVPDIEWHGQRLGRPDWKMRHFAFTMGAFAEREEDLHVIVNMEDKPLVFQLPSASGRRWHTAIDTAQPSPSDIIFPPDQKPVVGHQIKLQPRSIVVLEAR